MIRIRGVLEILQVATHAGRVGDRKVIVNVAIGALPRRHGVHSCERKVGKVVVERRVRPGTGGMTLLASLREI